MAEIKKRKSKYKEFLWQTLAALDLSAVELPKNNIMRRGSKHRVETIALMQARRAEGRRKRQKALAERWHRERPRDWTRRPRPFSMAHRIALAIEPGAWYGRSDIWRAAGLGKDTARWKIKTMVEAGFLERAKNPDYRPQVNMERPADPLWLYRLTSAGEALRVEAGYLA